MLKYFCIYRINTTWSCYVILFICSWIWFFTILLGIFTSMSMSDTSLWFSYNVFGASLEAQTVKRLPAMREARVWFLGREDPLEKEMAIHSSTLAWKIPWTEEPDRLQSMGSQRVGFDWATSLYIVFGFGKGIIGFLKWVGKFSCPVFIFWKSLWWCSVTKSCLTFCDPVNCSMPDSSVLHYLLEFAQIHVHWARDSISTEIVLCCHLLLFAFSLCQYQGLFKSQLFASDGQSFGASASVLLLNIQSWFPWGLTWSQPQIFIGRIFIGKNIHWEVFSTVWFFLKECEELVLIFKSVYEPVKLTDPGLFLWILFWLLIHSVYLFWIVSCSWVSFDTFYISKNLFIW